MLRDHLPSSVTRRRLRQGPAAEHIDRFADWLHRRGYKPISIETMLRALAGWTDWMRRAGLGAEGFLEGYDACKATLETTPRVPYSRGPNAHSLSAARTFLGYLREQGIIPRPVPAPTPSDRWPIVRRFREWLAIHRGAAVGTQEIYERVVVDLVLRLGDAPETYTAERLRTFVYERARTHGLDRAKQTVTATRAFVRFLGVTGRCPTTLHDALPSFSSFGTPSRPPRFLTADEVDRVIAACAPGATRSWLRDRAVILLLARLGLRAGDVAGLRLDDIDWKEARIALCGKGRRHEWLPLPQDVGEAIVAYLKAGRPPLSDRSIFTTVLAPLRPLTRAAVTHVVRAALRRAGVQAPINAAHVLRHSAATAMLREGASLGAVGAVLRHRSPQTTLGYARVDFRLLFEIAQPWPGAASC